MSANPGETAVEGESDLQLVLPGRGSSLLAGWGWMVGGWKLFALAPLMWIISFVGVVFLAIVMSLVPILGSLAFQVLQPVFSAGFVVGCRALEKGGEFEVEHLLAPFSRNFVALLIVGAINLLGWLAIMAIFLMTGGLAVVTAVASGNVGILLVSDSTPALMLKLSVLVSLALALPLMAAYWFAPALVMMHGMKPAAAMKASFFACFRNFFPFTVYSVIMLVALMLAMIPLGLGILVWIPLAITSNYIAYRRIFTNPPA